MKSLKYSVLLALLVGQFSWAGVVHGGGGTAIVSRDVNGKIQSAELLDLFEARAKGIQLVPDVNLAANYGAFMTKWISYNGGVAIEETEGELYLRLADILSASALLPAGQKLPLLNDFTTGPIPTGYAIEQLAIFNDTDVLLTVDKEIWNALSNQSRAALIAHEMIYRNERLVSGGSDSNKTRQLVGRLFSTRPLAPLK